MSNLAELEKITRRIFEENMSYAMSGGPGVQIPIQISEKKILTNEELRKFFADMAQSYPEVALTPEYQRVMTNA